MDDIKNTLAPATKSAAGFKITDKKFTSGTVITKGRNIRLAEATQDDLEYLYNLNPKWRQRIAAPAGYTAKAAQITSKKK